MRPTEPTPAFGTGQRHAQHLLGLEASFFQYRRAVAMDRGRIVHGGSSQNLRDDSAKREQFIGVARA